MLFPTVTFAAFFMAVWPVVWAVARWPRARQAVLLAASAGFYAYWDWRFLWLLALTVGWNVAAAQAVHRAARRPAARRAVLWVGIAGHLGLLGWFKYYGFFASTLTTALDRLGIGGSLPLVQVALPLGISFVTFQAISHLIEVRRGVLEPGATLEVATWLCFFPTITSGPITRASELLPQLRGRPDREVEATRAGALILRGLFKKVVLSSYLAAVLADDVFARPDAHGGPEVLLGIYAYAVQLYVDFSGYTDIALGCGLLLGIRLPANFDRPYAAATVTEFWSRWHMTLTRWMRDFVFTPLVLRSRPTAAAAARNLLVVMLLVGLWHGAAWTFVAFGLLHGGVMAIERALRQRHRRLGRPVAPHGLGRVLRTLVTFHVVCLGWVLFRADSLAAAGDVLARLATGWGEAPAISWVVLPAVGAVLLVQLVPRRVWAWFEVTGSRIPLAPAAGLAALTLLAIDVFGPEGVAPFLYMGF